MTLLPPGPIRPRTVADELERRKGCRYGLRGVRIGVRGEPGVVYVCDGSAWDRHGKLRLDLVPAVRWEEHRASGAVVFSAAELMEYRPPDYLRRDVPAAKC